MPLAPVLLQAHDVVVGVNLVNAPYDLTAAKQETILAALQHAGVLVIRGAIPPGDKARGCDHAEGHDMLVKSVRVFAPLS